MSVPVALSNLLPERLYLSNGGDGDIYVNNGGILWRNQIDGLRGLFSIFKKKNPGVILNDASKNGKTVLVSLFIESIQSVLGNPVLILCHKDHEIDYWKEILLKWTKFTEDNIAINSTNPYLKKNIFLQSMDLSNTFFRRCWSVLILKNDEMTKEISKMVFDAEFKIWITSVDVFKDLDLLSRVGKFINPGMNINTTQFEMRNKNLREKIETVVLMETSTKDFVVRSDHLKSILQKRNDTSKTVSNTTTKKNKDASGTKIKKSKRKINDEPRKYIKKVATKVIATNDGKNETDEDSLSLISFISLNKIFELRNTQKSIKDDSNTREVDNGSYINNDNNTTNVDQIDIKRIKVDDEMSKEENSTQLLTGSHIDDDDKTVPQINLNIVEDVQMSPKLNIEDITKNEIENDIKSDDIYEKETIDMNVDTSQIHLNYTKDVSMELGDEMIVNKIENEIVKSENVNVSSNEVEVKKDFKCSDLVPDVQATADVEDAFDKKMIDLETKTLMKFKGSILDSIF